MTEKIMPKNSALPFEKNLSLLWWTANSDLLHGERATFGSLINKIVRLGRNSER